MTLDHAFEYAISQELHIEAVIKKEKPMFKSNFNTGNPSTSIKSN